jgi:lipopolysaccharide transport system ATP-binding protein
LRNVSFELAPGKVLGIIGPNGAGKTTILKLLSKITWPTEGHVAVKGRVSSLIELGAGFHPDLTGRENVYLNGTILGMNRSELDRKFDAIVAFAELEPFMDVPVKRYSSGMYARLGFAVAALVQPDTLLIDEVLAVGDTRFQYKCYEHIRSLSGTGTTIVFVSHNLFAVERLCDEVLWLDHGTVQAHGRPRDVISAYLQALDRQMLANPSLSESATGLLRITSVELADERGMPVREVRPGGNLTIIIRCHARESIGKTRFALGVSTAGVGRVFYASMLLDGQSTTIAEGDAVLKCHLESLPLMPGSYEVWGEVWDETGRANLSPWSLWSGFRVTDDFSAVSQFAGSPTASHSHDALVFVPYRWELEGRPLAANKEEGV